MAAEASFKTDILSIVLGSILSKERPGTPSTTTSGLLLFNVLIPRIRSAEPSYPGSLLGVIVTRPGNRPAKLLLTLVAGDFTRSVPLMLLTDPVRVAFFCVPYPTTTTSVSACANPFNCKLIVVLEPTGISC